MRARDTRERTNAIHLLPETNIRRRSLALLPNPRDPRLHRAVRAQECWPSVRDGSEVVSVFRVSVGDPPVATRAVADRCAWHLAGRQPPRHCRGAAAMQ